MFDVYSQTSMHARTEAYMHSGAHSTWQDVRREVLRDDPEFHPGEPVSERSLQSFLSSLRALLSVWIGHLRSHPAKRLHVHSIHIPLKHHHVVAHAHVHHIYPVRRR